MRLLEDTDLVQYKEDYLPNNEAYNSKTHVISVVNPERKTFVNRSFTDIGIKQNVQKDFQVNNVTKFVAENVPAIENIKDVIKAAMERGIVSPLKSKIIESVKKGDTEKAVVLSNKDLNMKKTSYVLYGVIGLVVLYIIFK